MKIGQALTLMPNIRQVNKNGLIDKTLKDTQASFGETLQRAITDVNNAPDGSGEGGRQDGHWRSGRSA